MGEPALDRRAGEDAPGGIDQGDVVRLHDFLHLRHQIGLPRLARRVSLIILVPVAVLRFVHRRQRLAFADKAVVAQPQKGHGRAAAGGGEAEDVIERATLLARALPDILKVEHAFGIENAVLRVRIDEGGTAGEQRS
ncbi:MAG: hypothetical protein QF449_07965 [Alphaproteobacteria bacterium]|nr:hypothetical protein [Alphaproteobacteria bacterium]